MFELTDPDDQGIASEFEFESDVFDKEDIEGGAVIHRDGVSVPDRNVDRLTKTLQNVQPGDTVRLKYGTDLYTLAFEGPVLSRKGPRADPVPPVDWDYTVEIDGPEGTEDIGLMYRIGIGDSDYPPWTVFSANYHRDLNIIEEDTVGLHGFVIDVVRNP